MIKNCLQRRQSLRSQDWTLFKNAASNDGTELQKGEQAFHLYMCAQYVAKSYTRRSSVVSVLESFAGWNSLPAPAPQEFEKFYPPRTHKLLTSTRPADFKPVSNQRTFPTNVSSEVCNCAVPPDYLRSEISFSHTCNIPNFLSDTAWNASLVVCAHGCAIVCALKQRFSQCKIFLEGTLLPNRFRPTHAPVTVCLKTTENSYNVFHR